MESLSQPRHRPQLLVRRSGLSPSPPPGQTDATTLDGLLLTHQHQSGSAAPDGPAESSPHGWRLASCMHLLSWSSPEVLRGSQAICTLLQLILAPNLAVRSEALYALWNISADEEGALAISSHGGMPLIVKAVSVGEAERHACVGGSSTGLELQRCAVAALRNLAVRSEAALPLYEAGIMPSLLRLLQKGNGVPLEMKHDALLVLWQMSSFQPLISPMLQAGLADGLIALLGETMRFRQPSGLVHSLRSRARQPASSNGESDTTNMVLAICCICCNLMIEEVAVARLLELNVIGSLIPLLEGSVEGGECEAAAACLENICITQPHFTRECVLTGGVDALLGVMRRCGEACPEEGHSTLSHTIRAMLAVAGTDAGLLTILRGQGLQLCVALISLPLRSRMQCMLLELTILILEGSHPQSRYPTSDKILSELSSQLHALLSPPSLYQTRSHEVTQRALHALRIALTQRPTDSAVAEMGRQLPILSFLSHELLVGWCDQSGERVNKVRAMACDAAACVGLLAMEESTAASLVKQGAIGALIALLPNARDEQKTPKIKCNSPLRVEPYKRTPPSWRHSEISAIEAGYQLRLQVFGAVRQLVVRCEESAAECLKLDLIRLLLEQLRAAPHTQLRAELVITIDRLSEYSVRIAEQLTEIGGTSLIADAILDLEPYTRKEHPLSSELDFGKSYISPWAAEDAEPHGCTWPGSFIEAVTATELGNPAHTERRSETTPKSNIDHLCISDQ